MNAGAQPRWSLTADDALYGVGLACLCLAVLVGITEPLLALPRWVALDSNEGWNAFFAQRAMGGGPLYPPPGSLIINNYPPLSFYIVGALGRLMGDNIFAGRVVSLLAMLAVVANVYAWLRSSGSPARIAALGAALTAAFAVTYARSYTAMNDPQWLAHAIMTSGLVVIWRGNASTRAIVLGALIMIVGGFTKHLLVPLPLATTWLLLRRSKSAASTWILTCALLLALFSAGVWGLYGPAFFDGLHSARQYSSHQAFKHSVAALKCFAPAIALSLALLPFARRDAGAPFGRRDARAPFARGDRRAQFALVYLAVAAAVAFAASGGIGVDINAFFDLMIAASLCAALAVEAWWDTPLSLPGSMRAVNTGPVLTLLLGGCLIAYAASLLPGIVQDVRALDAFEQDTLAATRLIAARGHGHAVCESPELCYWAKNEFLLDVFNYGQRLKVGKESPTACESLLDGHSITLVQLDPNRGAGSKQLPDSCNAVILRRYRPVMTSSIGVVLAPAAP